MINIYPEISQRLDTNIIKGINNTFKKNSVSLDEIFSIFKGYGKLKDDNFNERIFGKDYFIDILDKNSEIIKTTSSMYPKPDTINKETWNFLLFCYLTKNNSKSLLDILKNDKNIVDNIKTVVSENLEAVRELKKNKENGEKGENSNKHKAKILSYFSAALGHIQSKIPENKVKINQSINKLSNDEVKNVAQYHRNNNIKTYTSAACISTAFMEKTKEEKTMDFENLKIIVGTLESSWGEEVKINLSLSGLNHILHKHGDGVNAFNGDKGTLFSRVVSDEISAINLCHMLCDIIKNGLIQAVGYNTNLSKSSYVFDYENIRYILVLEKNGQALEVTTLYPNNKRKSGVWEIFIG